MSEDHVTDRAALEGLDREICERCGEVNTIPDDGTELSKHKCGTLRVPRALLASLYDIVLGTMDWGSDFFDEEAQEFIRDLAGLLDLDKLEATQKTHRCKYRGRETGTNVHEWVDWRPWSSPGHRTRWCVDCGNREYDPPLPANYGFSSGTGTNNTVGVSGSTGFMGFTGPMGSTGSTGPFGSTGPLGTVGSPSLANANIVLPELSEDEP